MSEPRQQLARALESFLTPEQITKLVDEVLSITKRANVEYNCKFCGKNQMGWVQVHDAKAVALALPDLLNQAYGRVSETSEKTEPVIYRRLTNLSELSKET